MTLTGEGPVTIAKLRHRVSASIQVADIDGDGADEVLVAGRSLQAFSAGLKRKRFRFPRGRRPFASTPAAVPGFGSAAVFVGCDDGRLYANTVEAASRGGVFVETGLDIYSSPVVFEHNGERLITFGSDDERIYCVRQDGTSLEGFPVSCGAFVSATPAVGDFDGDGAPEIVVGDWNGALHALCLDGKELPKFPFQLGQPTWSSVALADINGDGDLEAVVADRYLHAVSSNAEEVAGFPQLLGSYTVGSPIVVDGLGDGKATIVVASDKLYAVNGNGWPIAGFPVDLGAYQWASPLAVSKALSCELMFVAAGWDGKVWAISAGGKREELLATGGPIFSTPAVVATDKGACSLVAGSWDGRLYSRPLDGATIDGRSWPRFSLTSGNLRTVNQKFRGPGGEPANSATPPAGMVPTIASAQLDPAPARHRVPTFIHYRGKGLEAFERATVFYKVAGQEREHPTPVYLAGGEALALFQPLGVGRRVNYHFEGITFDGEEIRVPAQGEEGYLVERLGPLPIGRFVAAMEGH